MTLYSRYPIAEGIQPPSPGHEPIQANPHLRWHPLPGEWMAYASHRQGRTFRPSPEYNPLVAGMFAHDALPQAKAKELRAVSLILEGGDRKCSSQIKKCYESIK
jgi:hypothetical protein